MQSVTTNPITGQTLYLGRPLRFWLLVCGGAILLLLLLTTYLNYGLVYIAPKSAAEVREGTVRLAIINQAGDQQQIGTLLGLALVPRTATLLTADNDNSATTIPIATSYLSIPSYAPLLQPQHKVSKIGTGSAGCDLLNQYGEFSYSCTKLADITRMDRPDNGEWTMVPDKIGLANDVARRYKNGLLALNYPTTPTHPVPSVSYIVPGEPTPLTVNLPKTVAEDDAQNLMLYTDQTGQNTGFVVANVSSGQFWYLPSLADNAQATSFTRDRSIPDKYTANCAMNAERLACYYGASASGEEGDSTPTSTYIELTPLATPSQHKVYNIDIKADALYYTANKLYLLAGSLLYDSTPNNDSISPMLIAHNASNVHNGTSLYYTADNGIFEYRADQQASHLRFRTSHLRNPNLSAYGDSVIMTAYVNTSDDQPVSHTQQIYRLTNEILAANATRPEDTVPYAKTELPINALDYDDTGRVYVNISPVITSDSLGNRDIDTAQTKARIDAVTQKLRADGVLKSGSKLILTY